MSFDYSHFTLEELKNALPTWEQFPNFGAHLAGVHARIKELEDLANPPPEVQPEEVHEVPEVQEVAEVQEKEEEISNSDGSDLSISDSEEEDQ
jgi:hypothetical protein